MLKVVVSSRLFQKYKNSLDRAQCTARIEVSGLIAGILNAIRNVFDHFTILTAAHFVFAEKDNENLQHMFLKFFY